MKRSRKLAVILLATQLAALVSCGGEASVISDTTSDQSGIAETNISVEISRENTPDSLPELDFEGATIRIACLGDDVTRRIETEGEETGDVVSDAVFARNRSIEERLNVKLEFIPGDKDKNKYMANVKTVLMAGEDAYDIIDAIQYQALPQTLEGLYYNLADAPYLDYTKPWWADDYMNTIQVTEDARYLLMGDISVWKLRFMSCMYYNKRLYDENFGDPNDQYQTVLDGNWTYDALAKNIKDVWQDVNNDGNTSDGDILGLSLSPAAQIDHYTYTAGMVFSERDKNGYPTLKSQHDRSVKIVETLYNLCYETPGTMMMKDVNSIYNEQPAWFRDGELLYLGMFFYTTEELRDMKDSYGLIPFPKLDDTQENYRTLIHDGTTIFAVPITAKSIDMPCAVLEAMCAETYRKVTPAYYEVALKVKYTHDDMSSQVIDMIHSNAATDFVYANNYCFTSTVKLGTITRTLMGLNAEPSKNFMSAYDSIKTSIAADLESIIAQAEENA